MLASEPNNALHPCIFHGEALNIIDRRWPPEYSVTVCSSIVCYLFKGLFWCWTSVEQRDTTRICVSGEQRSSRSSTPHLLIDLFIFLCFFFSLSFFHTLQSACPSRKSIIFSFSEQIFVNPFGNEEYRAAATRKWLISGLMTCRRLMDTYGFWFRFNYAKIFHFQTRSIICEIYITLAPSYHS